MKASQTVFLTADRTRAVPEGHKDAQYLLVREGGEIADEQLEKYDGAAALVGRGASKSSAAPAETKKTPKSERGSVKHRDPRSK